MLVEALLIIHCKSGGMRYFLDVHQPLIGICVNSEPVPEYALLKLAE